MSIMFGNSRKGKMMDDIDIDDDSLVINEGDTAWQLEGETK